MSCKVCVDEARAKYVEAHERFVGNQKDDKLNKAFQDAAARYGAAKTTAEECSQHQDG